MPSRHLAYGYFLSLAVACGETVPADTSSENEPRLTSTRAATPPRLPAEADAVLARAIQSDPEASVRVLAIETVEGFRAIAGFIPTFAIVHTNDAMPQLR